MPESTLRSQSPAVAREALAAELVRFIQEALPEIHPRLKARPRVAHDTPLFESGLIDSLAIVHLMAFIERATGRKIPPRQVVMKHFRTIDAICDTFADGNPQPREEAS